MASVAPGLPRTRRLWVVAHRWAGLTIAAFLIIAAVTGAVLPFEEVLTFASRPDASRVAPTPRAKALDGVAIAQRVERATGARVAYVPLEIRPDRVVRMFVASASDAPPLRYDVVWADPYTGAVRLTYKWGGFGDGMVNVVPFLYSLHYGFIAGPIGRWAFGIAALIWTLDCFVGFYLTLPIRRVANSQGVGGSRPKGSDWLLRWRPAWRVRRTGGHKLVFDLHRAGGLWLWPVLFVFAWSAVALSLPQVEQPVMRVFGAEAEFRPRLLPAALDQPPVSRATAAVLGRRAFEQLGAQRRFSLNAMEGLSYDPGTGLYRVLARTSLDVVDTGGRTAIWLDGRTGEVVRFAPPQGATAADGFMAWLEYLHMAAVFGLPYRIAVSLIGMTVTGLTVTGVLVWMRKRSARLLARPARVRTDPALRSRGHHARPQSP